MSGLRYDSLADLPQGVREQVAGKLMKEIPMAGGSGSDKSTRESKYGNKKTTVDGITFDSQKEARRYVYLKWAEDNGLIYDLRLQHEFTLQEAFTARGRKRTRAIRYKADFTYRIGHLQSRFAVEDYWLTLTPGTMVIEDVKSNPTRTKEYNMKKKMMAAKGYIIYEV